VVGPVIYMARHGISCPPSAAAAASAGRRKQSEGEEWRVYPRQGNLFPSLVGCLASIVRVSEGVSGFLGMALLGSKFQHVKITRTS